MKSYKLTISYDGTNFFGYQRQPGGKRTVQEALEAAIEKITGAKTSVLASGRTDAGVHALRQVVGFRADTRLTTDELRRALNVGLPDDLAVLEVVETYADFHPISDVKRKRYRYVIHNGEVRDVFQRNYCWQFYKRRLDVEAMRRAAQVLLGTHDFSSFESSGAERKSSVRTVFDVFLYRGEGEAADRIVVEIEADGFLYNMVRAIVGSLVEIGRGVESEAWLGEVLRAKDRRKAGPTAPAQGLFLVKADYPESRPHKPRGSRPPRDAED